MWGNSMNTVYKNLLANFSATLLKSVALLDSSGVELSGGNPAYSRKSVDWSTSIDGVIKPSADVVFSVPANTTVAGLAFYDTTGSLLGSVSVTQEHFTGQGEYKILASSSSFTIS